MRNLMLAFCVLCSGVCLAQEKRVLEPGTTFFLPSISATLFRGTGPFEPDLSISITTEEKACVKIYGRDTIAFLEIDSFSCAEAFIPSNYLFFDSLYQSGTYIESDVPVNVYVAYINKNSPLGYNNRLSFSAINQHVLNTQKNLSFNPINIGRTTTLPHSTLSDVFIIAQEIISHENENEIEVCFKGNVEHRLDCFNTIMSSWPGCGPTHLAGTCTVINMNKNQRIGFMMGEKIEDRNFRELRYSTTQSLNQKGFSLYTRNNAGLLNLEGCVTQSAPTAFNTHQVMPENHWSNTYYLPPRPEHVAFLLTCFSLDTLEYLINGNPERGANIDTAFYAQDMVIKANQPFGAVTGTGYTNCDTLNSQHHPHFISHPIVGPEEYYHRTCFAPFTELDTVYNHYMVNLVVPTAGIAGVRHKGLNINPALFTPFRADSTYSWATIEIDTGYQCIESDSAFLGILYTYYRDSTFNNSSNRRVYAAITHLLGATPHFKRDTTDRSFHISDRNQKTPFQQYDANNELCMGDTVWFIPPAAANTLWVFDFGGGNKRVLQTHDNMKDSIAHVFHSSGYHTVIAYDSSGCKAGDSVMVFVQEETDLDIEVNLGAECEALFIELAVHNYDVDSAQWKLPENIILNEKVTQTTMALRELPFKITLKAWVGYCMQEEEILVSEANYIEGLEYIPNVFTPNGDGKNDCWQIGYKDIIRECYEVHILNRWGQLMFHSTTPEECWDGNTQNKQPAAEGVYFYHLKIGKQLHQGTLQLFR